MQASDSEDMLFDQDCLLSPAEELISSETEEDLFDDFSQNATSGSSTLFDGYPADSFTLATDHGEVSPKPRGVPQFTRDRLVEASCIFSHLTWKIEHGSLHILKRSLPRLWTT